MRNGFTVHALLLLLISTAITSGCSLLRDDDDAELAYENTRRAMQAQADGRGGVQPASYQDEGPQDDGGFTISDLAPANASKTFKKLTGNGPNRKVAQQTYREAESKFRLASEQKRQNKPFKPAFVAAAETYKGAAARWPNSALEQDALFMSGDGYFFADNYVNANTQYELLLKSYPNTRHLDTVNARRFSIAKYWLDADRAAPQTYNFTDRSRPSSATFGQAIKVLDKIRLDDPTGKLADDATMMIGNAYFEKGKFIDAGDHFEDLIRTFPSSEHQFTAHLLGLKSKLESYEGPDYEDAPLIKAEKLLKQIRRQFPREAEQHRESLVRTYAEIRYKMAEREMKSAKYYDRRGYYGAARLHYETLVKDFADTPFGERARQRIGDLQSEPANPPQRLSWLIKLFPDSTEAKPLIPAGHTGPIFR